VAVGIELRAAEELEDALLHPLGDDVLESLGLFVDLVPGVAQDLDENISSRRWWDELEGDLAAFAVSCWPR